MMKLNKILSVIAGIVTIGLLSSVFAKIQGALFPASLELFDRMSWSFSDNIQLVLKLICVYSSCILGGMAISFCGGASRQHYIVSGAIMLVVGWLWLNTAHPVWFWALLIAGILPFIMIGNKLP
ncbi:hypothetical protein ODZ84_05575 [Chryseobacterium fluminis]|uniref:hypothetical protein n=1 Tax=Chryseobacterium fluminis TaxID=2983606 RepID=UPI00224E491D|nr:hypothetical protein [Chryseobacterium sp. MMS21-Ot14]UZT99042.1 hypothetical protein ODZ84_05575 [Chryseobacterium sp. MMS21-Ot14]